MIAQQKSNTSKMNVLMIVADDMGMQMSALNTPGLHTPAIDSLVKNGVLLTRAYATFPSCSPSRTSFLTGTFPHVNGVTTNVNETLTKSSIPTPSNGGALNTNFAVKPNITTLVEVLKEQGYYTGLTGKFHIPSAEKFPFDYWGKKVDASAFFESVAKSGKPFFLSYNFHSPHRPYQKSPYDREKVDLNSLAIPPFLPNNKLMQQDWSNYLGAIEATDNGVNDLLSVLKEKGLDQNTLIVFLSDHGPSVTRGKYYEYDFSTRVPVVFCGPGILKDLKTNALASLVDIMPTVLDILNFPIPNSVQGKSLKNLLKKNETTPNQYVYSEVAFPRNGETNYQARTIFDGRFWYIRRNGKSRMVGMPEDNYEEKLWGNLSYKATLEGKIDFPLQYNLMKSSEGTPPLEELYDTYSDPWNMHNISNDAAYANALLTMQKAMDDWILKTDDREMVFTIKPIDN
ncbi:MAG TPA: sulfatase [Pelobium sp.]|nr:sulfatase [Pelobium sp.]